MNRNCCYFCGKPFTTFKRTCKIVIDGEEILVLAHYKCEENNKNVK